MDPPHFHIEHVKFENVEECGYYVEECVYNVEECVCNVEECACNGEECGCYVDVMWMLCG